MCKEYLDVCLTKSIDSFRSKNIASYSKEHKLRYSHLLGKIAVVCGWVRFVSSWIISEHWIISLNERTIHCCQQACRRPLWQHTGAPKNQNSIASATVTAPVSLPWYVAAWSYVTLQAYFLTVHYILRLLDRGAVTLLMDIVEDKFQTSADKLRFHLTGFDQLPVVPWARKFK